MLKEISIDTIKEGMLVEYKATGERYKVFSECEMKDHNLGVHYHGVIYSKDSNYYAREINNFCNNFLEVTDE